MSAVPEYSIAVKPPGGVWEKLGRGQYSDVQPEGITHSHALPGGPETFGMQLARDTRLLLPDELPFTEIACKVAGIPCWSGRLMRSPRTRGASSLLSPQGEGWWPSHLYDYPIDKTWVIADLSRWIDARNAPSQDLSPPGFGGGFGGTVEMNGHSILLKIPNATVLPASIQLGVMLDMGPNNTAKSIVLNWESSANDAGARLYVGNDTTPVQSGSMAEAALVSAMNVASGGPTTYTFATARRYVFIFFTRAVGATYAADVWVRINSASVFTDSADISANASDLHASTVISEAIGSGYAPKFSTDTSSIAATTFDIPEYFADGRRSIGDICTDVNAYHQYQLLASSDPIPRAIFRPVPTSPTYIIRDSDAYTFDDAGTNDGAEIFDTCILQYEDASGVPAESIKTASGNVLDKISYARAKVLVARSRLTAAGADQIAQAYVDAHSSSPVKGTVKLRGTIERADGQRIPVGAVQAGDAFLLGSEINPDTGSRGRIGIAQRSAYRHDDLELTLNLDSSRNYIDALLERVGILSR